MEWHPEKKSVTFHFDDLLSNFAGLEGYRGPRPGIIVLTGVSRCLLRFPMSEKKAHVFSFECDPSEGESTLMTRLSFWPSGIVEVAHAAAEFPEDIVSVIHSG